MWNDIWHNAPLQINFLIRLVNNLLPSNANLVRWGKKEDPTCPLCQGRQTIEYALSSCKIALSRRRYTWRHNRVFQELATIINMAQGQTTFLEIKVLIFTIDRGFKSCQGRSFKITSQGKCLLAGCDDWEVSADLPKWASNPSIIKGIRLRPDVMVYLTSTQ